VGARERFDRKKKPKKESKMFLLTLVHELVPDRPARPLQRVPKPFRLRVLPQRVRAQAGHHARQEVRAAGLDRHRGEVGNDRGVQPLQPQAGRAAGGRLVVRVEGGVPPRHAKVDADDDGVGDRGRRGFPGLFFFPTSAKNIEEVFADGRHVCQAAAGRVDGGRAVGEAAVGRGRREALALEGLRVGGLDAVDLVAFDHPDLVAFFFFLERGREG
jgi:hypothetical protein